MSRFSKPLQVKVFVGHGATREYVASIDVALLKRLCTNIEECSEKSAGGSSVLVERADRQTIGWFLRWLSQGQTNPIEPTDSDQDERLRVCLARLYVFQKLGVILPSGKPEDLLMEEIANIVKSMPRIMSMHAKYVYEHFSDARTVDYGQVFAALIVEATLNGSLHGMKDKTFWKSAPFVLFERNLRAHLLSKGLLARIQRIQEFKPISTDLLGFLLRFSNQGDQVRASLANGLIRLERSHRVADAGSHCGDAMFKTGFKVDIDAARAVGAKAHRTPAKEKHTSAKPRRDNKSGKVITSGPEEDIPAVKTSRKLNDRDHMQDTKPNEPERETANGVRHFPQGGLETKQQQSQRQVPANRGESEANRICNAGRLSQAVIPNTLPREVQTFVGVETKVNLLTMASLSETRATSLPKNVTTFCPHDIPKVNGSLPIDSQPPKPRIIIRLPPPPATSTKKSEQVVNGKEDLELSTTDRCIETAKVGMVTVLAKARTDRITFRQTSKVLQAQKCLMCLDEKRPPRRRNT